MTREPATAAGRTHLEHLWPDGEPKGGRGYGVWFTRKAHRFWQEDLDDVLAIEAEAAATDARLAEGEQPAADHAFQYGGEAGNCRQCGKYHELPEDQP